MPTKKQPKQRSPQQQPVISIRITEELRGRLEKLRQMLAIKTGQPVSTSDAAKQLLESARDDRIEMLGLLLEPTDSLMKLRKKLETKLILSQAEWTVLAYYCTLGAEAFVTTEQGRISRESLAVVLEAFLAAYEVPRRKAKVALDWIYFQTLPAEERRGREKKQQDVTDEDVRRVVKRTIQMLRDPAMEGRAKPILAVRNLYMLLDDEKFTNAEKLHEALWPYWKALWKVVARGHWATHKRPLRERFRTEFADRDFEDRLLTKLPSFEEGGYRLEFARVEANEITPVLALPGPLMPRYPLYWYPRVAEFRRMLETFDLEPELSHWKGYYFMALAGSVDNNPRAVTLLSRDNGIGFSFPIEEWKTMQSLFQRAWQAPAIAAAWESLSYEYGEL
ncbi:MAG: hypothetical protein ACLGSD_08900 [Acidobacteriota bacterium]